MTAKYLSMFRAVSLVISIAAITTGSAQAEVGPVKKLPDPRGEFLRQCMPHMVGRWAHPEQVCSCLHDHATAAVADVDLREAVLRGISETGVPTIETAWVPLSKQSQINATFSAIAKPTLQCMYEPLS